MEELDLYLLRQESEHYALTEDETYGKISKTILELLDELDRKNAEIKKLTTTGGDTDVPTHPHKD